jgi:uncharacterized membrane protein YoaK (UPF0700 family)
MLYGNRSISYYSASNIAVWMIMAFQAGIINIGGFMACHRFVSHVTGFATFVGMDLSELKYSHALGMLFVPGFFLMGSIISGILVDIRLKQQLVPRYYLAFGIMTLLMMVVLLGGKAGLFGVFGEPFHQTRDFILLAFLCLVCGIQNGTITSVSKSVIRTTHLTGITTDLGIGLVRMFYKNKTAHSYGEEGRANLMRAGIIFFFFLGSVFGGIVFRRHGYSGFLPPTISTAILFFVMIYFQVFRFKTAK